MDSLSFLKKVGVFAGLSEKHLKGIAQLATERSFSPGQVIMTQGEPGIGLFIIMSGKVSVEKKDASGKVVERAENGPGDVVGEFSVLDGAPRSASVSSITDTKCLALASWEFKSFMQGNPEIAVDILPIILKKFRETNEALIALKE